MRQLGKSHRDLPRIGRFVWAGVFACLLVMSMYVNAWSQDVESKPEATPAPTAAPAAATTNKPANLTADQENVGKRYEELEKVMLRMAELTASSDPRRAALLRQAVARSKDRGINGQFESLVELLKADRLAPAVKGQTEVRDDLNQILDLLLSEDRGQRIESEKEKIREYIKRVNKIIKTQKGVQGGTAGQGDAEELSGEQGKLADQTSKVADDLKEDDDKKNGRDKSEGKPGEKSDGEDPKGDEGKGESSEGKPAHAKPMDGQGKPGEGDQSKPSHQKPNDEKPGEGKPEDGKSEGDEKNSDPNADKNADKNNDKKNGEKPESEKDSSGKPADSKPGEKPEGEQSPSESKPGEQSEGEPQPMQGKPKQGKPMQGQPMPGGKSGQPMEPPAGDDQQVPPPQDESPTQKNLRLAQEWMKKAKEKLDEANRKDAVEEQQKALENLQQAIAELERILRQLREEEITRTLAMLEERFRKMLDVENDIFDGTKRLDKVPMAERDRDHEIEAGRLSRKQAENVADADRALAVLREEGSAVALPEAVGDMRDDMEEIVVRLAQMKVGELTQSTEQDVIAALEEIVGALEQAQKDMEQNKQQPMPPMEQQQQGEQEEPLVDQIAELKMIRALQMRVNKRTERYAALNKVEQAEEPDMIKALQRLADRQQRIHKVTRDIVVGRNQ